MKTKDERPVAEAPEKMEPPAMVSFPYTLYRACGVLAESCAAQSLEEFEALVADGWQESPEKCGAE